MTLGEVATQLKLPKSSALTLLRALVVDGVLCGRRKGPLRPGPAQLRGRGCLPPVDDPRAQRHSGASVADRVLGVTSHFAVLEGDEVIYLAKHDPPGLGLKLASSLGARLPAAVTAVGKAQLGATANARTDRLRAANWKWYGRLGYAVDDGQTAVGIRCVAAPLFNDGGCCGAIGVSYLLGGGSSAATWSKRWRAARVEPAVWRSASETGTGGAACERRAADHAVSIDGSRAAESAAALRGGGRPGVGPLCSGGTGAVKTDALLLDQQLTIALGTRELPSPAGEALVRVAWAGVCGSDLHVLRTGAWVAYWPATLGPRGGGRRRRTAREARSPPGPTVVVDSRLPCGKCPGLRRGPVALPPDVVAGRGSAGRLRPPSGRPGAQPCALPGRTSNRPSPCWPSRWPSPCTPSSRLDPAPRRRPGPRATAPSVRWCTSSWYGAGRAWPCHVSEPVDDRRRLGLALGAPARPCSASARASQAGGQ